MTGAELLKKTENDQSYQRYPDGRENPYTGHDKFEVKTIKKGTLLYALAHDGDLKELHDNNKVWFEYFFDKDTLQSVVSPDGKTFDSKKISEIVQVNPFFDISKGVVIYRDSILCFEVKKDFEAVVGICEMNNHFGGGGGHQLMYPYADTNEMLANGDLAYRPDKSLIKAGQNNVLSISEYTKIKTDVEAKNRYCREHNVKHPRGKVASRGFKNNRPIEGEMFGDPSFERRKAIIRTDYLPPMRKDIVATEHKDTVMDIPQIKQTINKKYRKEKDSDEIDRSSIIKKTTSQDERGYA